MPMFPVPFVVRIAISVVLVVWGARTNRRWVVPIAAGFAIPAVWGFGFLPFVVAATRLVGGGTQVQAATSASSGMRPPHPVVSS
jgi:hypothetical protein